MKKLVFLLLLATSVQAEMQWFGLYPYCKAGNAGDSGQVTIESTPSGNCAGSFDGFEVEIKIVDSSAGTISADSSYGTWYTTCINTEDVKSATGLFEIISITDTPHTAGHLSALGGDSTFVTAIWKTGYVEYDANALTLVAAAAYNAVSGTATRTAITLPATASDTLFKPYTWCEFTVWDSTRWGQRTSGPYDSTGSVGWVSGDSVVVAGTYSGKGELGRYHVKMYGCAADDPDSMVWVHYGNQGHVTSVDTVAITGAAQDLDSGMTLAFDDATTGTDGDIFIFHVSDSLHYGKTVKYKIRIGLDLNRTYDR